MENWKDCAGFENMYQISNLGNVRSLKYNKVKPIKKGNDGKGYQSVSFMKDNAKYTRKVHRLVGEAFLVPVVGKTTIDHIDQNPSNNNVCNLRWADYTDQRINTKCYSNTGHKNISKSFISNHFHVVIKRYKSMLLNVAFPTLEEAIKGRDEFLKNLEVG
tara:strand:+ start:71 stop:550 length:480 start_codon:yes stop_codon:yes gene_type:complete